MAKEMPDYLYHYSPKENRNSIMNNGLIGSHEGKWCIYLAENPESWKRLGNDLYRINTENLNPIDFTSADETMDEVLYWGRIKGKIAIPKEYIELIKER